jgi:NitT/TauT family transport system permease protein
MFIVILIYDQLLFRPLVAWAEKFKSEQQANEETAESWVINLFRRTRLIRYIGQKLTEIFNSFVNNKFLKRVSSISETALQKEHTDHYASIVWSGALLVLAIIAFGFLLHFVSHNFTWWEVGHVFVLGLITACRVFVMIAVASLIWVPAGIWIGLRPGVSQIAQPIAQIMAAFPANLLYPFVVVFIVHYELSPTIWLTPLMILGSQWYILFNVIAGASTIPKELLQVVDNLGVVGKLRWSRLLLPAIFPYYVTGAITAAGGAWNASIVAEVVSWGNHKLEATGLGSYITNYTTVGNFAHTALGIGAMCVLVLMFNRLIWRPLYVYAENRFSLE